MLAKANARRARCLEEVGTLPTNPNPSTTWHNSHASRSHGVSSINLKPITQRTVVSRDKSPSELDCPASVHLQSRDFPTDLRLKCWPSCGQPDVHWRSGRQRIFHLPLITIHSLATSPFCELYFAKSGTSLQISYVTQCINNRLRPSCALKSPKNCVLWRHCDEAPD